MAITDNQIALLRHAAADPHGEIDIEIPAALADGGASMLEALVLLGYVETVREHDVPDGGQIRRLRITQAGRQALEGGPADG